MQRGGIGKGGLSLPISRNASPCWARRGGSTCRWCCGINATGRDGQCSARYSALAQEWLFLALVNHESGFIWRYFYRHPGVFQAHIEMYGGARVYLPLVLRGWLAQP